MECSAQLNAALAAMHDRGLPQQLPLHVRAAPAVGSVVLPAGAADCCEDAAAGAPADDPDLLMAHVSRAVWGAVATIPAFADAFRPYAAQVRAQL